MQLSHTQERIDEIITRNLENTAEATPALIGYRVFSPSEHIHMVEFSYNEIEIGKMNINMTHKTFNGRTWS